MQREGKTIFLLVGLIALSLSIAAYAQQHDHAAPAAPPKAAATGAATAAKPDVDIFCTTMKTGQLCTHGTANVLGLTAANAEKWQLVARKYNKSVDAATLQLFKDAEGMLTPAQMTQLKAWFDVGLNPQINELLFSKGLGPKKE